MFCLITVRVVLVAVGPQLSFDLKVGAFCLHIDVELYRACPTIMAASGDRKSVV